MGKRVKTFADGSFLEYDWGNFDKWCVYLTRPGCERKPPRDTEYFAQLKQFARKHTAKQIYADFLRIYEMTGKEADEAVLARITEIASGYGADALEMDIIFTELYLGMIAEEQKQRTKLGKRIKRLGMHMLLVEGQSVDEAANGVRGKDWREIDRMCRQQGF